MGGELETAASGGGRAGTAGGGPGMLPVMKAIRFAITVFLLVVLALTGAGMVWMSNSALAQKSGGLLVLALGGIGALVALFELWKPRSGDVQH